MRVLHVTDPHLYADPAASLRGTVTYDSLRAVLEHVRAAAWTADFVAVTGDLVQDDSAAAYEHLRELFATLGLPIHCVPGNHDVRPLMKAALSSAPFHYCDTWTGKDWAVIGIDSCLDDAAGGRVPAAELERVRALAAATDAHHVLVCLHHPPQRLGSRWLDQVGLENADEFLGALAAIDKVRGCLFGHAHQAFEGEHDTLSIIGTPSTCSQFLPESDTFALDDRPPAYRRVTLLDDGRIDSELVWLDGWDARRA